MLYTMDDLVVMNIVSLTLVRCDLVSNQKKKKRTTRASQLHSNHYSYNNSLKS